MRIRMILTAAGPRLPHGLHSGHVYEVSEELGTELVGIRAAELAPASAKPDAPVEVATIDAGERATVPGSEKKLESLIEQLTGSQAEREADGKTDDADADEAKDNQADEPASDAAPTKKSAAKASAKKS